MELVRQSARRGNVLVETALVLPLLLVLTLGLLEYGWLFLKAQQITNASRQGARVGARADATVAEITAAVDGAMAAGGLADSGFALAITPVDPSALTAGETLTVEISVPYANIGLGVPLVPTPAVLDATVTMAREGPP